MYIVHVFVHVKPSCIEDFKKATLENAKHSLQESGIKTFELMQQIDDPTRFLLVEVYVSALDQAKHKETTHYNKWREIAEPMMLEPRSRVTYNNIFPVDGNL